MKVTGILKKMKVQLNDEVHYSLALDNSVQQMNELIGREISLTFSGTIYCLVCGRKTKKSFFQGLCFPCFKNAPEASDCIIRPELCLAHLGQGRDPEWEKQNHLQDHIVYLADSGGIKVGVTRCDQIPTRWIDQGAVKAVAVAKTPYRQLAGQIEVYLKSVLADKTAWQRMLKNLPAEKDLQEVQTSTLVLLEKSFSDYLLRDETILTIKYPIKEAPEKVKSLSFDKESVIQKQLVGIKGQYLIFSEGFVLNIRRFGGYEVTLEV